MKRPPEIPRIGDDEKNVQNNLHLFKEVIKMAFSNFMLQEVIGQDEHWLEVLKYAKAVAQVNDPVLIEGETGTGKEVVARLIHGFSPRSAQPFFELDVGAIPITLLESELFGYEKGAFTDATIAKPGLVEVATFGTLLLDEMANLCMEGQAKLLKFLDHGTFLRLGSTQERASETRIIAASNVDLKQRIASNVFRLNLYHRLSVLHIKLPPLRERKGDIPLFVEHFLKLYNEKFGKAVQGVSESAMELLKNYPWPGNVRELQNVLQRILLRGNMEVILPEHLSQEIQELSILEKPAEERIQTLKEVEWKHIEKVFGHLGGNIKGTARALGISRNTLKQKLLKYGMDR
jgi:transcriptional regulator with PAS, ATPase and Fis domain